MIVICAMVLDPSEMVSIDTLCCLAASSILEEDTTVDGAVLGADTLQFGAVISPFFWKMTTAKDIYIPFKRQTRYFHMVLWAESILSFFSLAFHKGERLVPSPNWKEAREGSEDHAHFYAHHVEYRIACASMICSSHNAAFIGGFRKRF